MNRALAAFKAASAFARVLPERAANGLARAAGYGAAHISP